VSGAGCESCLTVWAKDAEARLCALLDAAAVRPGKTALRSLAADWPATSEFAARANRTHFGIVPDWPLVEKFTATAAPLIARVAGLLASGHDVVQVQAGSGRRGRPAATEVWRAPAARLADGTIITQRGDVLQVKVPNIWGLTSGRIPDNKATPVLVRRGEQIRLGNPGEPRGESLRSYFPLESGECLDAVSVAALWRRVLTAMADTLP
jgi:hypothetical protein